MERKLVSMVDYILEIDWLTTSEFCKQYKVPLPTVQHGVNGFLQVDAIKHRMFVEYAKFLNKKLTYDMFEGGRAIFIGGKYTNRQPSRDWNSYDIAGKTVFRDSNTEQNVSLGHKVNDLVGLGIMYKAKEP